MTFKYRVGQRVTVVDARGDWGTSGRRYIGAVATIMWRKHFPGWDHYDNPNYYGLDCSDMEAFAEACLKPLNDGDNPSTWEEGSWRPNLEHPVLPSPSPIIEKEPA